jgi:N-acetylglucosamine-6-phosphate deacetylase
MIKNVYIVLEDKMVFGDIILQGERIADIVIKDEPVHFVKRYVIPGFIDLHIHGSNNYDVMDGSEDAIEQLALSLVKEGTTAFLATTLTQSKPVIIHTLKVIQQYHISQNPNAAILLGVHLEGPFINRAAAGAQSTDHMIPANISVFDEFNHAAGHLIKKVSLAPEIEGSMDLIQHLSNLGIVSSIAHTKADYQTVVEAIALGASSVTHTYNAMTPFHHREIGVVGAALLHDELTSELILDKVHVSIPAAKLLVKNKGYQNITLITDAMRAKQLPIDESELGGQKVNIQNGEARLIDGTLAGSVLCFIDGFRNALFDLGLTLVEASYMSSTKPAKQLKIDAEQGSIGIGKLANLVILDEHYAIEKTILKGKVVFER